MTLTVPLAPRSTLLVRRPSRAPTHPSRTILRVQLRIQEDHPLQLADGSHATVLTISDRMCRWPIGDPSAAEFHFCGHSPKAGSPYCEAHARKAYQPQQARRESKDVKGRMAS